MSKLIVYYQEKKIGTLSFDEDERLSFEYEVDWIKYKEGFPLSLALKLEAKLYGHLETKSYFENLLPEGEIKELVESHGKSNTKSEFGFLQEFGADCAGALRIIPENSKSTKLKLAKKELKLESIYKYLNERKSLADVILNIEGGKFSLAGAQDKFAVIIDDSKLYIPFDGSPTTHIIKPHVRYFRSAKDSPFNEYFCMCLARKSGLNVPNVDLINGEYPLFVVERFDREVSKTGVSRIHQQDFCQAQGMTSLKKYESDGGPTFRDNYFLVMNNSVDPIPDLNQLLKWLIFNLLIGNNDSHSKNVAFIQSKEGLRLSPLYDLLSTSIYKELKVQKFSFAIGGQRDWFKLKQRHFDMLSADLNLKADVIPKLALKLINEVSRELPLLITEFNHQFPKIDTANILKKEIEKRIGFFERLFA